MKKDLLQITCPTCRNVIGDLRINKCPRCSTILIKPGCSGSCTKCIAGQKCN